MKKQTVFFIILFIMGNMMMRAQNCNVNAGANAVICGTSANLSGSPGGSTSGNPLWTLISKPAGAPDPVISNPANYNTSVTGMNFPGNYVFQISQNCTTGSATNSVTITAPGDVSTFTAGVDITDIPATTGTATLQGVIPSGYTASWTYYNLYDSTTTNATMANSNTATPTLSLTKKADHNIDPAYRAVLRITSINNPNCWYEDEAIIRFIPNPQIVTNPSYNGCFTLQALPYIDLNSSSPRFVTNKPNTAGNPAFGTTVTINTISQPAGANISFGTLENQRMYFNGANVPGNYIFTITVSNTSGTYTTPQITFTNNGVPPNRISFVDSSYPDQLTYRIATDGSAVYCNMAGQTTPVTFYFKINSADPAAMLTTVSNTGVIPAGGSPSLVLNGAGTMNRNVVATPPTGGWRVGTYKVNIAVGSGICTNVQPFYIHISDGSRPNVTVSTTTVCYPGSGIVTATIPLPSVYVGTVNSSYLQDFTGRYDFTLVSKPAGAATPVYGSTTLTSTSATISNLDKEGEYVFKIKAVPSGDPKFLEKEYACSGTSLEGTFSIFVSAQVGANAGSAQNVVGSATIFNGNNPGVATGLWTLVSKPAGAPDPVIVNPALYNTNVTGLLNSGIYTFRWTVTTGTCSNSSDLTVNVSAPSPGGVPAAVWYKADAITSSDNTALSLWNDQMGTGYNLIQATTTLQPTFSNLNSLANFNPTVTFNSTGHTTGQGGFMSADPGSGKEIIDRTKGSIYIAGKMNTLGAAGLAGFDPTMDYPGLHISNNATTDKLLFYTAGSGYTTLSTNLFTAKKPFVAGSSWLNAGGSTASNPLAKVWLNGNESAYTNTLNNVNTTNTARAFRIGRDTNWGSHDGQMNEAIVFATSLTASEKSRVDSYLAVKWGSTLISDYVSSANNIVWNASADYQNNILGIARDNISTLYQKQSRSENPDQKLIIGSGSSLANTNAANTNTLTEGQFLITGDNGLKQILNTPLSYTAGSNGEVNFRFEAIWKVQNTNTVGTITIAWPKGVKNLYVVQSANPVFDAAASFTPMATETTVNGVVYNTANVTLTNGQYFTFAGFLYAPGGVAGSEFWIKSDDAGNIATAWKDNSINANDIPAVGTWSLSTADRDHNFHPYTTGYSTSKLFYNSTSSLNSTNGELPNTSHSIFSAVRPSTSGNGRITGIDDDVTYAAEPGVSIANGKPRHYEYYNVTTSTDFSTAFNIGSSNIFSAIADNSIANGGTSAFSGGEKRLGLNGTYETTTFNNTNKFQLFGRNLRVGQAGWDAAGAFPGDIMEVIWYKRALTANEQSRINSYLAVKNGITLNENYLATNSSIVWDKTNNTGYNSNIFGIAKDNVTVLNQKQSGSINNGQKLIISTTGFADNNAANGIDLTTNQQYLMIGDNNLKQGLKTPLAYTGGSNGEVNFRFEAIWKAQNTGSVGQVTVAWPKGVKNLYLVQSADETFDTSDNFTPMTTEVTINGVLYKTANVTLANGQFFTFAGFGLAPGGVVNNLSYWYRADKDAANTGDGTDITAWTDQFSGTTSAQLGTNALPKFKTGAANYFNFNPGVNFTANAQTIGNTAVRTFSNNTYDIFILTKEGLSNPGSNGRIFSSLLDNSRLAGSIDYWDGFGDMYDNRIERVNAAQSYRYLANPGGARSTIVPSIMYHNLFNTSTGKGINGGAVSMSGVHPAIDFLNGGHAFGSTQMTGNGSDNGGFVGNLGETIIYGEGNLTTTERRKVDSYLAIKYGITLGRVNTDHYLATDETIVWNGATGTAFNNNIFGITRDDLEVFEQKVSKSANTGTILTMATTNDFVSPNLQSARTGFVHDKTYFLIGDNNVTATPLVNVSIAGNIVKRIQRIWLSQRLNTPGALYFEADLSAYGSTFSAGNSIQMLVADDAAFTTNVKMIAGVFTGGKWVFLNDFNADSTARYITFAEGKTYCYEPGAAATAGNPSLPTKFGITALGRAGGTDNWPMVRKGGWLALEAKTKGFVPNRVKFSTANQPVAADGVTLVITAPVEGMMVYDTTNKCMKMYTLKEGDSSMAWHCISTQTCPD